jgi:D-arabinose 1-dehydrogenase-like Zn-dependent alcohol dehydrogenase
LAPVEHLDLATVIRVSQAGHVLVKIEACGVCHTDLHAAQGDWPVKPHPPFIDPRTGLHG